MPFRRSSNLVAIPPTTGASSQAAHGQRDPRRAQACLWRTARRRLFDLPEHIRAYVRLAWSRVDGRRDPASLLELIRHAAAQLGAAPTDFPHLDAARRRHLCHQIDRAALHNDPLANGLMAVSPGVRRWLDAPEHRRFAPLLSLRQRALESGLRQIAFRIGPGSHGQRWEIEAAGLPLDVAIHRVRPRLPIASETPWNADLCQRVIFIKRVDEALTWLDTLPMEPTQ